MSVQLNFLAAIPVPDLMAVMIKMYYFRETKQPLFLFHLVRIYRILSGMKILRREKAARTLLVRMNEIDITCDGGPYLTLGVGITCYLL